MADTSEAPAPQPPPPSPRLRLARAARDAALDVPGVHDTDAGPLGLYLTAAGGQRVEGVVCAATREGGYEISLKLIADLVPLPALSERVQTAVRRAARSAGLTLSAVSVEITGVATSAETDDAA
jgi:uncharacterized alkaline shock family protein YloU